MAELYEKLTRLRLAKGLSQRELAEKLGRDPSSISQWESGIRKPRMDALRQLASEFGVSLSDLLEDYPEQRDLDVPDSFPADFIDWLDRMGYELRIVKKSNN